MRPTLIALICLAVMMLLVLERLVSGRTVRPWLTVGLMLLVVVVSGVPAAIAMMVQAETVHWSRIVWSALLPLLPSIPLLLIRILDRPITFRVGYTVVLSLSLVAFSYALHVALLPLWGTGVSLVWQGAAAGGVHFLCLLFVILFAAPGASSTHMDNQLLGVVFFHSFLYAIRELLAPAASIESLPVMIWASTSLALAFVVWLENVNGLVDCIAAVVGVPVVLLFTFAQGVLAYSTWPIPSQTMPMAGLLVAQCFILLMSRTSKEPGEESRV